MIFVIALVEAHHRIMSLKKTENIQIPFFFSHRKKLHELKKDSLICT
jgi:hypothetical protein